jgi:hypothetical protein
MLTFLGMLKIHAHDVGELFFYLACILTLICYPRTSAHTSASSTGHKCEVSDGLRERVTKALSIHYTARQQHV